MKPSMASKSVVQYLNFCLKIDVTNLNHMKLEFVGAVIYHTHVRTKLKPMHDYNHPQTTLTTKRGLINN